MSESELALREMSHGLVTAPKSHAVINIDLKYKNIISGKHDALSVHT